MSYAGDLTPEQAWAKLASGAVLVDVRTQAEWTHIGIPRVPQAPGRVEEPLLIQWNLAGGAPNRAFLEQLRAQLPQTSGTELVFLCRSGQRSIAAAEAATAAGYISFNVLEGFEGVQDAYGDRTVNGWKNRQLPWKEW
ncbi:MAG TPA: rhodanese-like domain-containing protein [Micrococcaceae bacterium]|jgi:rhodanese-related sulfurtransferase|nr:rhodanese-like domain-containing protein [Micrococcaceae bacterium]